MLTGKSWVLLRLKRIGTILTIPSTTTGENRMDFQRGNVVLIPFPYTDLTTTKTRPAVVVSSGVYHAVRSELLLAYISSQLTSVNDTIDYLLADWQQAGLLKPSFMRPKIAAIEPSLVVYRVGALSANDMRGVDQCLRQALSL